MNLTSHQEKQFAATRIAISAERARDIVRLKHWEHGGCLGLNQLRPNVPELRSDEKGAIQALWDTLPEWTSWMTALYLLAQD